MTTLASHATGANATPGSDGVTITGNAFAWSGQTDVRVAHLDFTNGEGVTLDFRTAIQQAQAASTLFMWGIYAQQSGGGPGTALSVRLQGDHFIFYRGFGTDNYLGETSDFSKPFLRFTATAGGSYAISQSATAGGTFDAIASTPMDSSFTAGMQADADFVMSRESIGLPTVATLLIVPASAPAPSLAQAAPTLGTATDTTQPLAWDAAQNASGTVSYDVQRAPAPTVGTAPTDGTITTVASGLTIRTSAVSGLSPATRYGFRVIAHDAGTNTSATSAWAYGTMSNAVTAPVVVTPDHVDYTGTVMGADGQPARNKDVTFTLSPPGRARFADGQTSYATTTDANGVAHVPVFGARIAGEVDVRVWCEGAYAGQTLTVE